jgi:RNA polymerase sigma factor (sigma-70 family)
MTQTATRRQLEKVAPRTDQQLIDRCLKGDTDAWSALIDRYKNLIYSIPMRLEMHQEAADIFQAVCVQLFSSLSQLREPRALPKWLMTTCYHECLRHRRNAGREASLESSGAEETQTCEVPAEEALIQVEQQQTVRDAISQLPARCAQMIRMLFFETPVRPYEEVARELGLATGSIGFIRGRCLARLRKTLEKRGF